jgi:tRNA wybutosine-synthesizing protein 2
VLGARFVLNDVSGIGGELREPEVSLVLPPSKGTTEIVHVENGIRFSFDPLRIMFSSGNVRERTDATSLTRDVPLGRAPSGPGGCELVMDMFAGIGYFSLPIASGDPDVMVISCEKNPASYRYLIQNIILNGLSGRIIPVLGDCRNALPSSVADRIHMGYLGGTIAYLSYAIDGLSPAGGIVHLHDTVKVEEGADRLARRAVDTLSDLGREAVPVRMRRVKSYAPRTDHVVIDLKVGPSSRAFNA